MPWRLYTSSVKTQSIFLVIIRAGGERAKNTLKLWHCGLMVKEDHIGMKEGNVITCNSIFFALNIILKESKQINPTLH